MYKHVKSCIFAISFFLLFSCAKETDTNHIVKLQPTVNQPHILGKVSDIIQLETTDESLIEYVYKAFIDFDNNRIILLSGFNIYIFDSNGKFITKLKKGKGPGEINMIISFSPDNKNKCFYAIDLANFICVFDYNGNMIKKRQIDFYSSDIHTIDADNVFLHCNFVGTKEKHFIAKYNFKEDSIMQKYVPSSESPYSILAMGIANKFMQTGDRLFYSGANVFGLFELKADTFQRILSYELGDRAVPKSFYGRYVEQRKTGTFGDDAREKNYVPYIKNSFYFNGYYLAIIDDENSSCYAIDEKNNSKIYMNGQLSAYFNLPEVESLRLPKGTQDDMLIFSCTPLDFFEENPKEESKEIEISGIKLKVEYDDNPFLIVIK